MAEICGGTGHEATTPGAETLGQADRESIPGWHWLKTSFPQQNGYPMVNPHVFFTGNMYFWLGIIGMSLFWETNPEPSSIKSSISNQFLACWETTCCINLLQSIATKHVQSKPPLVGLPNWNTVAKRRLRSCSAGRILAIHWPVEQFQWFSFHNFSFWVATSSPDYCMTLFFLEWALFDGSNFEVSLFKTNPAIFWGIFGIPKGSWHTCFFTWKPFGGMICGSFWKDSC